MADQRSPILTIDLDTGAGSHIGQGVALLLSASGGPIEAKGQKLMASSIPVTLASDQSTLPVSIAATVTVDTELPAAAALADAAANPTTPTIGSANLVFNGTTWDRARGDTTNGLDVDVTRVTGTVTVDAVDFPAAAAITDAFANPTTTSVMAMNMGWNGTNWDRLKSDTTNGLDVDVTRVSGTVTTTVSGTVTVDSELPAAAALTDAFANPTAPAVGAFLMGWNSATWDRLKSTTANGLVVDVSRVQGTVTVDSELPAAAALADATANPTTPSVGALNMMFNGTTWDRARGDTTNGLDVDVTRVTGTVTVDAVDFPAAAAITDAFANPTTTSVMGMNMMWNGASWDRVTGTIANGVDVDVTRVTGTVTVDSELPAAAALADDTANPTVPAVGAFLMGYDGATWDRVRVASTGRLSVDPGTPTTPANKYVTSASLAAGASVNLDTGEIAAQRLTAVEVWTSVAYKAELRKVLNTVADTDPSVIGGGQAFQSFAWKAPHADYIKTTASAGTDGFRVTVTNLDDSNAADVYATFHYEV